MIKKYALEYLIENFTIHHQEWVKMEEERLKNEWPIKSKDDFSLPIALKSICEEILIIKKELYEKSTPLS